MELQQKCKYCYFNVTANNFFCPNCGKEVKARPLDTGIGKQIGIYSLSVLLPPLGLWPGIKYLRSADTKAKKVGIVAILLTIIATIITFWTFFAFLNIAKRQLETQVNIISY